MIPFLRAVGAIATMHFLAVNIAFSQAKKLTINRIDSNVYVYTTYKMQDGQPYPSNSMYLVTKEGIILFDTPWDTTQFQPLLDSIYYRHQQKPILCIATHFHDDRTAGLNYFKARGIKTYSSVKTYQKGITTKGITAAYTFTDDTTFTIDNKRIEVHYPGHGHSPDNVVIWLPQERILYGGCFVKSTENQGLGHLADADIDSWMAATIKVKQQYKHAKEVIPGHMGWHGKKALAHTIKLLQAYKKQHTVIN